MQIKNFKFFFIVLAVVGFVACDDDDDDEPEGRNMAMINEIALNNNAEINMGTLAVGKAVSPAVKAFGTLMVAEHQKANNDLDTIADNRDIDMTNDIKDRDRATRDSINRLTGAAFDSAYIRSQVVAHTRVLNMFTSFRDTSTDAGLKAYVVRYIPSVQMHLARADSIFTVIKTTK